MPKETKPLRPNRAEPDEFIEKKGTEGPAPETSPPKPQPQYLNPSTKDDQ